MTVVSSHRSHDEDALVRIDKVTRHRGHRPTAGTVVINVFLTVFGILMLSPLVWLVVQTFTVPEDAFSAPPSWLPLPFTLQNFPDVLEYMPFFQQFGNSLILAAISTVGSLFFSVLAAYAFARIDFRGSRVLLVVMLSALMVPAQLVIIPIFIMMRQVGLVDTLAALWLPALINVFQIFFLSQYFRSVPRELDDAARIDGAGHLWILFRMLVPLSAPAIAALAILAFEASWNGYFGPLIFLSSPENMTLPLGLVTLQNGFGAAPAVIVFAAITMVVAPLLVVFLIFQRQIVESVASTGLKG